MPPIKFTTQLNKKDYIKAYLHILLSNRQFWFWMLKNYLILLFVLGFFESVKQGQLISILFIVIMIPLTLGPRYYRLLNRLFKDHGSFEEVNWEICPDFISQKGKSFESKSGIDQLSKVTETKCWLFLWKNDEVFTILPKQNISEKDLTELRNIFRNRIKPFMLKLK